MSCNISISWARRQLSRELEAFAMCISSLVFVGGSSVGCMPYAVASLGRQVCDYVCS